MGLLDGGITVMNAKRFIATMTLVLLVFGGQEILMAKGLEDVFRGINWTEVDEVLLQHYRGMQQSSSPVEVKKAQPKRIGNSSAKSTALRNAVKRRVKLLLANLKLIEEQRRKFDKFMIKDLGFILNYFEEGKSRAVKGSSVSPLPKHSHGSLRNEHKPSSDDLQMLRIRLLARALQLMSKRKSKKLKEDVISS